MKNNNTKLIALFAIFPFIFGIILGYYMATPAPKIIEIPCERCQFTQEVEDNITILLNNMHTIFDKYDILDKDGSDEMSELLEAEYNLAIQYNW